MADVAYSVSAGTVEADTGGDVADHIALMKPRVMFLVVFTALSASSRRRADATSGARRRRANLALRRRRRLRRAHMRYDADIDAKMARTAACRFRADWLVEEAAPLRAWCCAGPRSAGLMANWVAAAPLALTIGFYALVYTMWLKRSTPQNIVIGGGARRAAAGGLGRGHGGIFSVESFVLFVLVFVWTPPHFWALALLKRATTPAPTCPCCRRSPAHHHRLEILIYSLILAPLGMAPAIIGLGGTLYMIAASILGLRSWSWPSTAIGKGKGRRPTAPPRTCSPIPALYLFLLFAVLLVEQGFGIDGSTLPSLWAL